MNAETLRPELDPVDIDKVPWLKTRFPGIEAKTLMEQKESGLTTLLMRWAPGARLPAARARRDRADLRPLGSFSDHAGTCTAGNYVWRKAGSRHEAWTDEGCLVLALFLKPNMFFD